MAPDRDGAPGLHEAAWPDMFSSLQEAYAELTETRFELERRGAEFREERERFAQVIRSMSEALWLVDAFGVVNVANDAAARLLGRAPDRVAGHTLRSLWPSREIPASPRELLERAPSGTLTDVDAVVASADGQLVHVSVSCSVMRDGAGKITGLIVVARDITDRKRAEEAVALLAEASRVLSESLELDSTLARIADLAIPVLADCCTVHVAEAGGALRRVGLAHAGGRAQELARVLAESYQPDSSAASGPGAVIREGRAVLEPQAVPAELAAEARLPALRDALERQPALLGSRIGAPLVVRGEAVGAISLFRLAGRRAHDEADMTVAVELARRAATAIENAQMHAATRSVAETLQRSLLPERLPFLPGVALAARYLPAVPEPVGGDWYDVFEMRDGRLALVMGDVAGHGVAAAGTMGRLRHSLRAYAHEHHGPSAMLNNLNGLLELGEMATVLIAVLDPDAGSIGLASAGHLPPLVVAPGGAAELIVTGGPPLGSSAHPSYAETSRPLPPGSSLLLYTDGLVERRGERIDEGLERLRAAGARLAQADLTAALDGFVAELLEPAGTRDDVALLAARLDELAGTELSCTLDAEPDAVARLRRALRRWLASNRVGRRDANAILTASGEVCSNVVEHAYGLVSGPLELAARLEGDGVVVVVRDRGHWRAPREEGRGRGLGIARALMDAIEVEVADGTTVTMRRALAHD